MNILAFDISSSACSVALLHRQELRVKSQNLPMQQAKFILPFINELLLESGLSLNLLDLIAFSGGPGSFTGIRIASSVAQALCFAVGLPHLRISSLAVQAQAARCLLVRENPEIKGFYVAIDARSDHIYWAHYSLGDEALLSLSKEEIACKPHQLKHFVTLSADNTCCVGDAWSKYENELLGEVLARPRVVDISAYPLAQAVVAIAKQRFNEAKLSLADAIPYYLR